MRLKPIVFAPFFLILQIAVCTVISPSNLQYEVGDTATFLWNTTRNRIVEFVFGLYNPSLNDASPVFISGNVLAGVQIFNLTNTAASRYTGRVKYIGDLDRGHAWFTLSSLTINDAGVYVASIREQGNSTTSPFPVNLIVSVATTTAQPIRSGFPQNTTNSTATTPTTTPPPEANYTTTAPKTPTPIPLVGVIVLISLGTVTAAGVSVFILCGCCCPESLEKCRKSITECYNGVCPCCPCPCSCCPPCSWCSCCPWCCCPCCPQKSDNESDDDQEKSPEQSGDVREKSPEQSGDVREKSPEQSGDVRGKSPEKGLEMKKL